MKLTVSDQAVQWFKNEVGANSGEQIRFYPQFYGSSPLHESYSLAFSKDNPINQVISTEKEGILFFVEESDLWFFNGHDLFVDYDGQEDAVEYKYMKGEM